MVTVAAEQNPSRQQEKKGEEMLHTQNEKTLCLSEYEKCRQERIKENLERMQKLGIFDLSLKLKAENTPNRTGRKNKCRTPQAQSFSSPPSSCPTRRSSRLQNATPVSYSEVQLMKRGRFSEIDDDLIREVAKPEVYTGEHEKLLGECKMAWTLFVDGYGKDGKRIYDPVRGKTCHQCRQKTLGHRTHCRRCNMVQGQFCGDCLYMRYGENVLEANQDPDWICPVCRGICNCSLCRTAKGWAPTGIMYKKITKLGFKSVAHYLIQSQRSNADLEKETETKVPVSAKRSLPFSDMEMMSKEESQLIEPKSDNGTMNKEKDGKMKETQLLEEEIWKNKAKNESENKSTEAPEFTSECEMKEADNECKFERVENNKSTKDPEFTSECEMKEADNECKFERVENNKSTKDPEFTSECEMKEADNECKFERVEDNKSAKDPEFTSEYEMKEADNECKFATAENNKRQENTMDNNIKAENELDPECEYMKSEDECKKSKIEDDNNDGDGNTIITPKTPKKKCPLTTEPVPDSVAGRLRQRKISQQVDSIAGRLKQRRKCA